MIAVLAVAAYIIASLVSYQLSLNRQTDDDCCQGTANNSLNNSNTTSGREWMANSDNNKNIRTRSGNGTTLGNLDAASLKRVQDENASIRSAHQTVYARNATDTHRKRMGLSFFLVGMMLLGAFCLSLVAYSVYYCRHRRRQYESLESDYEGMADSGEFWNTARR